MAAHRGPRYRAPVSKPAAKRNARSRMWASMRIGRRFTAQDIAATAEAPVQSARVYINALIRIGYVKAVVATTFSVGSYTVYQLLQDTGPEAPRLHNDGKVFDPNLNRDLVADANAGAGA